MIEGSNWLLKVIFRGCIFLSFSTKIGTFWSISQRNRRFFWLEGIFTLSRLSKKKFSWTWLTTLNESKWPLLNVHLVSFLEEEQMFVMVFLFFLLLSGDCGWRRPSWTAKTKQISVFERKKWSRSLKNPSVQCHFQSEI